MFHQTSTLSRQLTELTSGSPLVVLAVPEALSRHFVTCLVVLTPTNKVTLVAEGTVPTLLLEGV